MTTTLILCGITAIALISSILFKPYINIKGLGLGLYWIVALIGAIALICFNCVSISEIFEGITTNDGINPLKILVLFISMTSLSVFLGDAGFFDVVARFIFEKCKLTQKQLFFILYFVVAILTIFTSNDIIILTFTPPICLFCKRAKISPIPYLFGEFVSANTFSMALVIGNPTNIYLAGTFGLSFIKYLGVMIIPAFLSGGVCALVLYLLFRKSLSVKMSEEKEDIEHFPPKKPNKFLMITALVHLLICIILLTLSDVLGFEMYIICLLLSISLIIFNFVYIIVTKGKIKKIFFTLRILPYELIPFVLSMFVLVLSLEKCGFTTLLSNFLTSGTKIDGITFGFTSALCANLLNNIPMSVLFSSIVNSGNIYALYGSIIGSNIGAFITPVGALAGIMWNKILKNYGVNFSFKKFVLYGTISALFAIIFAVIPMIFLA